MRSSGRAKRNPVASRRRFLSSTDWYPTLLEMMQIEKPADVTFDGVSQVPSLLGEPGPRESVVCFVPNYFPQPNTIPSTYIRRGPWKLIRFHGDGPKQSDRFELYNLDEDIGETKNLAATKPQLVKTLNKEITQYLYKAEAVVPLPNPAYDPTAKPTKQPAKNNKNKRNRSDNTLQ